MTLESINMLKWSSQQFKNFRDLRPTSLENDLSETLTETNQPFPPVQKHINSDFQRDPINLFYIQSLSSTIIEIPEGTRGFDDLTKIVSTLKENIRSKHYGPNILLQWDAATSALDSMTLKDYNQ